MAIKPNCSRCFRHNFCLIISCGLVAAENCTSSRVRYMSSALKRLQRRKRLFDSTHSSSSSAYVAVAVVTIHSCGIQRDKTCAIDSPLCRTPIRKRSSPSTSLCHMTSELSPRELLFGSDLRHQLCTEFRVRSASKVPDWSLVGRLVFV